MEARRALVVGAGFGGIAMCLRLKRLGYQVTVVDNNPKAGGRAQVYELGKYKFDGGPTVITAPFLLMNFSSFLGKSVPIMLSFCPLNRGTALNLPMGRDWITAERLKIP